MTLYIVRDVHRRQYFGPFQSKRNAERARTQIRKIPDIGLEIGTNVSIEPMNEHTTLDGFELGNFAVVMQQNRDRGMG